MRSTYLVIERTGKHQDGLLEGLTEREANRLIEAWIERLLESGVNPDSLEIERQSVYRGVDIFGVRVNGGYVFLNMAGAVMWELYSDRDTKAWMEVLTEHRIFGR